MKVRDLIKELMDYDMDAQVMNTYGNPIYYSVFKSDPDGVYLKTWEDCEAEPEIEAMIDRWREEDVSDYLSDELSNEKTYAMLAFERLHEIGVDIYKYLAELIIKYAFKIHNGSEMDEIASKIIIDDFKNRDLNDENVFRDLVDKIELEIKEDEDDSKGINYKT